MGNAYYKQGEIGRAILYYNRALVASPSMDDARYNLEIAQTQTKDKIDVVPEFFLNSWMRALRSAISCTAWSVLSLTLFGLMLVFALIFLLASHYAARRRGLGHIFVANEGLTALATIMPPTFVGSEFRSPLARQFPICR
jgi:tetratricopeptide (TPR) repeat protein